MKRFVTLVAAAALILGLAATASAELAIKAAGSWHVDGMVAQNKGDFNDDAADVNGDTFTVSQRMRSQLRFVYNENVMGELYTEYGRVQWGQGAGAYGAQGALNVKRAFIQFRLPDTDVLTTVGEQDITFPSSGAFSNMTVAGTDGGAIAVSAPITDMIGLTVAYARLDETAAQTSGNNIDAYLAAVPVSLDGMTIAPWFAYAVAGENSALLTDDDTTAAIETLGDEVKFWWAGAGFNMDMLDPIVIYADFVYGNASSDTSALETNGWLLDAMVEYKGLDFALLQGFGAYSSGNDLNSDGTVTGDALPSVASDWTIGGTLINGSAFANGDVSPGTPGFWLVGAAARDITFIEKLSHEIIVLYAQGTGDATGFGPAPLTKDDSYFEVDFNHRYQMYESLAAIVELAYAKPSIDDKEGGPGAADDRFDDALLKAAFGFQYNF